MPGWRTWLRSLSTSCSSPTSCPPSRLGGGRTLTAKQRTAGSRTEGGSFSALSLHLLTAGCFRDLLLLTHYSLGFIILVSGPTCRLSWCRSWRSPGRINTTLSCLVTTPSTTSVASACRDKLDDTGTIHILFPILQILHYTVNLYKY